MDGTDNECKEKGMKGKQELWLYSRVYLLVLSQPYPDIAAPPHPQLPAQVLIHSVGKAVNEAHAVRPLSVMGNCTLTSFWPNRREAAEGAGQSIINEVIAQQENYCLVTAFLVSMARVTTLKNEIKHDCLKIYKYIFLL